MTSKYISDQMAGAIGLIAALMVLSIFISSHLSGSEHAQFTDPVFLFIVLMAIVNAIFFSTVLFRD